MAPTPGYTQRHSSPGRAARIADGRDYCVAQHTSRREIDMAIGAYMGLHKCSEEQARSAIIEVARGASIGLRGVSQALLALVSDNIVSAEPNAAVEYWRKYLTSGFGDRFTTSDTD